MNSQHSQQVFDISIESLKVGIYKYIAEMRMPREIESGQKSGRKELDMKSPGKRKRGRPKPKYLDVAREDMQVVEAREDEVFDRSVWRICGDDP